MDKSTYQNNAKQQSAYQTRQKGNSVIKCNFRKENIKKDRLPV
jgi:hypothetical protein